MNYSNLISPIYDIHFDFHLRIWFFRPLDIVQHYLLMTSLSLTTKSQNRHGTPILESREYPVDIETVNSHRTKHTNTTHTHWIKPSFHFHDTTQSKWCILAASHDICNAKQFYPHSYDDDLMWLRLTMEAAKLQPLARWDNRVHSINSTHIHRAHNTFLWLLNENIANRSHST